MESVPNNSLSRLLFESAGDAILIFEPDTEIILEANPRACEIYGFTVEELVGKSLKEMTRDVPGGEANVRRTLADGYCRDLESVQFRRDGTPLNVLITASVIEYKGAPAIFSINRDITERRRVEASLAAEKAFTEGLLNVLGDPFCVLNEQGCLVRWNDKLRQVSGLNEAELQGRSALAFFSPEDAVRMARALEELPRTGQFIIEATVIRPDGSQIPYEFSVSSLKDAGGTFCGACGVGRDLTERRKAEMELARREKMLRSFYDSSPLPMGVIEVCDGDYVHLSDNLATARLLGTSPAVLQGKRAGELDVPPELIPEVLAACRICKQRGAPYQFGVEVTYQNESRNLLIYLSYLGVSELGRDRFSYVIEDVTEHNQEAEALRASETRFQNLLRALPDVVYSYHLDEARTFYFSHAAEALFGAPCDEICSNPNYWRDIIHPDDRPGVNQQVGRIFEFGHHEMEYRIVRPDGEVRWISNKANLVYDEQGNPERVVGVATDITARKQMEVALRESRDRFSNVVDSVRDVVFQTDLQGRFTFLNPAWEDVTGFPIIESLGRSFFDAVYLEDQEDTIAAFRPLYRQQVTWSRHELRICNSHDGYRWLDVSARLMRNEADEVVGVTGTIHDITEQQEAMLALQNTLERERELGSLKGRFVSMASHELRTPLTAVQSSAELLQKFGDRWDPERRQVLFNRIQSNVEVMIGLIDDVLLVGKADAGQLAFVPEPLDLTDYCTGIAQEFKQGSGARHRIRMQYRGDSIEAEVDPKLLRLILVNLLSNAIKYSPEGTAIDLQLERSDENAHIIVVDRGIGIPPADLPMLFEPFHRASNVESRSGTGLGLSIVKRAVDLHSGQIEVASIPGKGTTFEVILPLRARIGDPTPTTGHLQLV